MKRDFISDRARLAVSPRSPLFVICRNCIIDLLPEGKIFEFKLSLCNYCFNKNFENAFSDTDSSSESSSDESIVESDQ